MAFSAKNRTLVIDCEANGLLRTVTKMWCIAAIDAETEEVFLFHNFPNLCGQVVVDSYDGKEYTIPKRKGDLKDGVSFLMQAKKLVCHNYWGYDYFLIKKFFPEYNHSFNFAQDTLIQSKLQYFERSTPKGAKGPHGLQAFGIRFGVNKPEVTDWSTMDAFKLHRCVEDVIINLKTYQFLEKEANQCKRKFGFDFKEATIIETQYRYYKTKQEMRGALLNIPHMEECVRELTGFISNLREEIEPQLPPHLKVKSTKIGRKDLGEALGLKKSLKDKTELVQKTIEKNGETYLVSDRKIVKDFYRPTTKYTRVLKGKQYKPTPVDEAVKVPKKIFTKLKEAREWAKQYNLENGLKLKWKYPSRDFNQVLLNAHTCDWFGVEPDSDLIKGAFTRVEFLPTKLTQDALVKRYLVTLGWEPEEWNFKRDSNKQMVKAEKDILFTWPDKLPRKQRLEVMIKAGQPLLTSPKLTEDSYESIPEGVGKKIAEFNTYSHRLNFIQNPDKDEKGLLNMVRKDGRLGCGVNTFNTATGRSSHYAWVNAPSIGALYGDKIRQCVIAPKGRKLVGADMKSAQLSIAAYYANNYAYYLAIVDGQEVERQEDGSEKYIGESGHCVNARAFGLVTEEEWKRAVETQDEALIHYITILRGKSKGCTFGTIFGCSGKKLAKMAGVEESRGNAMKKSFLEDIGLDEAISRIKEQASGYSRSKPKMNKWGKLAFSGGYVELPMGYFAYCKQEHKLFNYIDQGTEGVMQKVAVIYFEEKLAQSGLDAFTILDYHDEFLVEASEKDAEAVGELMLEAYKYASDKCLEWHKDNSEVWNDLTFAFNLAGNFKIGDNYLSVH